MKTWGMRSNFNYEGTVQTGTTITMARIERSMLVPSSMQR